MKEIRYKRRDFELHSAILGDVRVVCVFGGRPEWDEGQKGYSIPKGSPQKETVWVEKESLERVLRENAAKGWTTWLSLNEKEVGNDTIEGVKRIWNVWFDFDAEREDKSKPAAKKEKNEALSQAKKLKKAMEEFSVQGFIACSGNGYHVFFPVEGFELPGEVFRREFNQKLKNFYKNIREKTSLEFDTTTDIRRVTQPIGFQNMKIPDCPLDTFWVDSFEKEGIESARKKNAQIIRAILNCELQPVEPKAGPIQHLSFEQLLAKNKKAGDLYAGRWINYGYKSRSEAEQALITIFCTRGFSQNEIKTIMRDCKIGKWNEKEESYHDLTIKKGFEYAAKLREEEEKREERKEKRKIKQDAKKVILDDLMSRYTFKTSEEHEELFVYKEGVYVLGEITVKMEVESLISEEASSHFVKEITEHIKRRTYTPIIRFNALKLYIPLKNGLLNIETKKIEEFDTEKIFTFQLDVEYDASAECRKINSFIREIVTGEDIPTLQEFFGYTLLPDMPAHKTLWLYGTGRNGKSTLISILRKLLNGSVVSVQLGEFGPQYRFSKARLYGKLANIVSEPFEETLFQTAEFKMLTGGDLVSAEVKNQQRTIDFVNFAKFIVLGNRFPRVNDETYAFWYRIIVIEFPNVFSDNAIPNYAERLIEEEGLSGFLNWCLEGLYRLKANNFLFTISKSSEEQKIEFMRQSDSRRSFFEERCKFSPEGVVPKSQLYEDYVEYCHTEGLTIFTMRNLTNTLRMIPRVREDRKVIDGKLHRCWIGICVKEEKEEEEEEKEEEKEEKEIIQEKSDEIERCTAVEEGKCELCGEQRWLEYEWRVEGKKYIICGSCVKDLRDKQEKLLKEE